MPNVCSLSSALHSHSNSTGSCGNPGTCREWKRSFCILFTAGRSGLMWRITYSLPLIYLHLRNGSWTANWNRTPMRHALRKNGDGKWGKEGRQKRGGDKQHPERVGEKLSAEGGSHFPFSVGQPISWMPLSISGIVCALLYHPNIWQKGSQVQTFGIVFTPGNTGAPAGLTKLAMSAL